MTMDVLQTMQISTAAQGTGQGKGVPLQDAGAVSGAGFMDFLLAQWAQVLEDQGSAEQGSASIVEGGCVIPQLPEQKQSADPLNLSSLGLFPEEGALNDNAPTENTSDASGPFPLPPGGFLSSKGETPGEIIARLAKLSAQGNPSLLSANLTPAQLNELLGDLDDQSLREKLSQFGLDGFAALQDPLKGAGNLNAALSAHVLAANQKAPGGAEEAGSPEELAAKLNALTIGESEGDDEGMRGTDRFKDLLRQGAGAGSEADIPDASTGKEGRDSGVHPGKNPDLKAAADLNLSQQGWKFAADGAVLLPALDQGILSPGSTPLSAQSLNVTGIDNLSGLVTQAKSATAPHPAMQMVVATVQKAAAGQGNTKITLQLDPPELGRVEVRMSFSKDKIVKTSIVAEKPETFMMLQRDSHLLERALQEAGLDSGDGSLSFELAQEGGDFGRDPGRSGGEGGSDALQSGNDAPIINTVMSWNLDPHTGHTHYNILA